MLITRGELTGGTLISFAFYQMSLSDAINTIGWVFSGMMDALGASEKVLQYIDRQPVTKPRGSHTPKSVRGVLEFKDVRFAYPSRPDAPVLNGVSFRVCDRRRCAVLGVLACMCVVAHGPAPACRAAVPAPRLGLRTRVLATPRPVRLCDRVYPRVRARPCASVSVRFRVRALPCVQPRASVR